MVPEGFSQVKEGMLPARSSSSTILAPSMKPPHLIDAGPLRGGLRPFYWNKCVFAPIILFRFVRAHCSS